MVTKTKTVKDNRTIKRDEMCVNVFSACLNGARGAKFGICVAKIKLL